MKRRFFSLLAMTVIGGFVFTSCTKDDTVAPIVTLKGDAVMSVDFNGTFTDPGATATDDVDNTVTVVTTGLPTMSAAGSYIVTYSATDAAGNVGTATRTVYVVHRKGDVAATYTASGNCTSTGGSPFTIPTAGGTYSASITPGSASNMAIIFNNLGDFTVTIDPINATLTGNSGLTFTIAPQVVSQLTFQGSGIISASGSQVTINYTDNDGTNTDTCTETWIKQ